MKSAYDITKAIKKIEDELIASMIRNLKRHKAEETKEGYNWSQWQVLQLKALDAYKRRNQKKYKKPFESLNKRVKNLLGIARQEGGMKQEEEILKAIENGFSAEKKDTMQGEFFSVNDRKLDSLVEATTHDLQKAETAVLRKADDEYRKIIFNAQVCANTGALTYEQAVDMATKDFLAAGIQCVEYSNGARHTLSDYADMAIRTASKRAYLQGEGQKRQEYGISTVILNKRSNPCPKCLPFVGKILIDDVWSGGSKDGISPETGRKYPLMSQAIAAGLYHPRCKDSHTTFYEGISTPPAGSQFTKEELEEIEENQRKVAKEQHAKRQQEKYERLAEHSLDPENQKKYAKRAEEWKEQQSESSLTLDEEGAVIRYVSPDAYALNDKLRRGAISELTDTEKEWVQDLDSALKKLPSYEGNLNRSVTFSFEKDAQKFFDSFIEDEEYIPRQYLSTTKNGVYNADAQVQIYIQNAKKGKDLGKLNDMEKEVLYPPMSMFKVVYKVQKDRKFYILLEELE